MGEGEALPVAAQDGEALRGVDLDDLRNFALWPEWRCLHRPRCADSICSYSPGIQRWIRGEVQS